MPLLERARIEVYLPDILKFSYVELLDSLELEFTYTFGGCSTIRGIEGSYLSQAGLQIRDRICLVYTDIPFPLLDNEPAIGSYVESLRDAAFRALNEEAVLVTVTKVFHAGTELRAL